MKVLVACEFSGVVRRAFRKRGHDAWSCDLLPSDDGGEHLQRDLLYIFKQGFLWDLIIAHPPCTHIAVCGAKYFKEKREDGRQKQAIDFFMACINAPADKVCVENPISIMSTVYRKPDQIVQPWQFGHGETKATCLWLKGLPKLVPTNVVDGRESRIHKMPPSKDRGRLRSITYQGIADAMASQWDV